MDPNERSLLGHLALWHGFSFQGEVLSTQGLSYLLEDGSLSRAVSRLISSRTELDLPDEIKWYPEAVQEDGRRPDLEGRDGSGRPVVKVEAKIWALLLSEQLRSYSDDQAGRLRDATGAVVILVPESRRTEAAEVVRSTYDDEGDGPYSVGDRQRVAVLSWEEVLDECEHVAAGNLADDVRQLRALVRSLVGRSPDSLRQLDEAYEGSREHWRRVVDVSTRLLTEAKPVYPFGVEWTGYERRYVVPDPGSATLYSIGICKAPDGGGDTPIWLRFHLDTPGFAEVLERLGQSHLSHRILRADGHIWIGLVPPRGAPFEEIVESTVQQARDIEVVALA